MYIKGKVKHVTGNGTWENDSKESFYKHEYTFEDGTIINALHKTLTPFPAGSEVEYEIGNTHPKYGTSGRVKKPDTGNSNYKGGKGMPDAERQMLIVRQSSLKCAVDYYNNNSHEPVSPQDIMKLADEFVNYVYKK